MPRKYELKERARRQAETRERIVNAAVDLHGTLGPARTTISAIAERAGVQRLTVYRHFPDELSLFRACSGQWRSEHPLPDAGRWAAIADPEERLGEALREIYAYFRSTEDMTALVLRDRPEVEAIQTVAAPMVEYWAGVREILDTGWDARGRRRTLLRAAIGHALEFETWRSLARREGLTDADAAALMALAARAL